MTRSSRTLALRIALPAALLVALIWSLPWVMQTLAQFGKPTQNPTPPATQMPPSGSTLLLESDSACRLQPADSATTVTTVAAGTKLPIVAQHQWWYLVQVSISASKYNRCWINPGATTVEGSVASIPQVANPEDMPLFPASDTAGIPITGGDANGASNATPAVGGLIPIIPPTPTRTVIPPIIVPPTVVPIITISPTGGIPSAPGAGVSTTSTVPTVRVWPITLTVIVGPIVPPTIPPGGGTTTRPPIIIQPTQPPVIKPLPTQPPIIIKPTQPPIIIKPTQPPILIKPTQPPILIKPTQPPILIKPTLPPIIIKPTPIP